MASTFKIVNTKQKDTQEAIDRAESKAKEYAGELNVEVLPLTRVEIDPNNRRELMLTLEDALNGINSDDPNYRQKKDDWKSLESLAKTIKDGQLINPIYVYRYGSNCRLISGERRTLASAIAGRTDIIARIAPQKPAGTRLRILQWIENQERAELTLAEKVASIEDIVTEYRKEKKSADFKLTAQLIQDLTGMSLTICQRYKSALMADSNVRKALDEGQIDNLKIVDLLCSKIEPSLKEEALKLAKTGASYSKVSALVKENKQPTEVKKETRGRRRRSVTLGASKPVAAKIIVESLMGSGSLDGAIRKEIVNIDKETDWKDLTSITKSFKLILSAIEKGLQVENK